MKADVIAQASEATGSTAIAIVTLDHGGSVTVEDTPEVIVIELGDKDSEDIDPDAVVITFPVAGTSFNLGALLRGDAQAS